MKREEISELGETLSTVIKLFIESKELDIDGVTAKIYHSSNSFTMVFESVEK